MACMPSLKESRRQSIARRTVSSKLRPSPVWPIRAARMSARKLVVPKPIEPALCEQSHRFGRALRATTRKRASAPAPRPCDVQRSFPEGARAILEVADEIPVGNVSTESNADAIDADVAHPACPIGIHVLAAPERDLVVAGNRVVHRDPSLRV